MLTNFADLWSYGQLFYKLFDKLVNFDIFHYLFDHTSNVNLSQDFLIESFCNFKFKLILLQGLLGLYAYVELYMLFKPFHTVLQAFD